MIAQSDATHIPLADKSVHCCVNSPPYWGLRDYGVNGAGIGLERTPEEYVAKLVAVFREVWRVLRDDGTVWLVLGDSYATGGGKVGRAPGGGEQGDRWGKGWADVDNLTQPNRLPIPGLKHKDLVGIPWRVAFALQADGWWLRSDIVWAKPNPMPESVTDRPTKSHEYVFLLAKRERYFFDQEAVREPDVGADHPRHILHQPEPSNGLMSPHTGIRRAEGRNGDGRNIRSVWNIATHPFSEAHFATFPEKLAETCIKAGCPKGGIVLDPFGGAGTAGLVADKLGRKAVCLDLSAEYCRMAQRRIVDDAPLFYYKGAN